MVYSNYWKRIHTITGIAASFALTGDTAPKDRHKTRGGGHGVRADHKIYLPNVSLLFLFIELQCELSHATSLVLGLDKTRAHGRLTSPTAA